MKRNIIAICGGKLMVPKNNTSFGTDLHKLLFLKGIQ
jgi:hypothetical protein